MKYQQGHVPHNKGKKMKDYLGLGVIAKILKTAFKKGENAGENSPSWKGGKQSPKDDCDYIYTGIHGRVRNPKKVYEEKHGKIPSKWIIYHLDRNRKNDEITNLIAVPRSMLLKLNNGRLKSTRLHIEKAVEDYLKL